MREDRILMLVIGLFFILFSFVRRFLATGLIKNSDKRSEEDKKKFLKMEKFVFILYLFIGVFWIVLSIALPYLEKM